MPKNRSMVKILLADGFYPPGDAEKYADAVRYLNYVQTDYGLEIPNFNMIFPNIQDILSPVIGEEIDLDEEKCGIFRKPMLSTVRFESFSSLNEWCFSVALEPTTFNLYQHLRPGTGLGEFAEVDSRNALEGYENFNYKNILEWNIDVNIRLQPNQGVFFRPWMFHSFEDGLIQHYRLISKGSLRE